jgi:hypothetical protein
MDLVIGTLVRNIHAPLPRPNLHLSRHGRACPGHPRLIFETKKDVDARHKAGHDDAERAVNYLTAIVTRRDDNSS